MISNKEESNRFLKESNVTKKNTASNSDLNKMFIEALKIGHFELVIDLFSKGALFTNDWVGNTPLHLAAKFNQPTLCQWLLNLGIDPNVKSKVDKTPLHIAAFEGHVEVIDILLKNGADVNMIDLIKMTPLHWAIEQKHVGCVKLLLENNASLTELNKFDKTPLNLAGDSNNQDIIELIFGKNQNVKNLKKSEILKTKNLHDSKKIFLKNIKKIKTPNTELIQNCNKIISNKPLQNNQIVNLENPTNNIEQINNNCDAIFQNSEILVENHESNIFSNESINNVLLFTSSVENKNNLNANEFCFKINNLNDLIVNNDVCNSTRNALESTNLIMTDVFNKDLQVLDTSTNDIFHENEVNQSEKLFSESNLETLKLNLKGKEVTLKNVKILKVNDELNNNNLTKKLNQTILAKNNDLDFRKLNAENSKIIESFNNQIDIENLLEKTNDLTNIKFVENNDQLRLDKNELLQINEQLIKTNQIIESLEIVLTKKRKEAEMYKLLLKKYQR